MRIVWSIPVRGEPLSSSRGDLVRAKRLIGALLNQGHEVRIVAACEHRAADFSVSTYRKWVRRLLPAKAALVVRDLGRWLHGRSHGRRIAAEARSFGAEAIVETQVNYSVSGAVAKRETGLPLVLDDCSPCAEEEALGAGLPGLALRIFRQQCSAAEFVTVPSEVLQGRFAEEGIAPEKLVVIPNGIDAQAYTGRRDELRRRFGLDGACVLGFAGSFQPWHDVELLIEAVAPLVDGLPLHVVLIGDGPGRAAAADSVARMKLHDRVTFTGQVDSSEIPSLLSMLDIGTLPGTNLYGQPMKLLEYGAAGLASVAPDVAPVREVLSDGVNGLLFPSGDCSALREAIGRLAADPDLRRQLGLRARATVLAEGDWARRAQALASLMEQRMSKARGSAIEAGAGRGSARVAS